MNDITEQQDAPELSALSLQAVGIKSITDDKTVGKFTNILVNSEQLGVLTPAQYRAVTNRNQACIQLARWAFAQLESLDKGFKQSLQGGFLTVYIPFRMFDGGYLERVLQRLIKKQSFPVSKLVFQLSSDVLYEEPSVVNGYIEHFFKTYGIRFMLSDYGNEFCPVLRITDFKFSFAVTDSTICSSEDILSQKVKNAVMLAKQAGAQIILGFDDKRLVPLAAENGFDMYFSGSKPVPDGRLTNV